MSWLDVIILLPILVGLIRGLMRGVIIEFTSILAVILGVVGARMWSATMAAWMIQQFAWQENICFVIAYAVLFLGITLVLNIVARLLSKLFQKINLGWLNRLAGAMFGGAKWGVIMLMLVLCLHRLDTQFQFITPELKEQSIVYQQAAPLSEKAWERFIVQLQSLNTVSQKNEAKKETEQ
jgi:membrane protein required for colicin V production